MLKQLLLAAFILLAIQRPLLGQTDQETNPETIKSKGVGGIIAYLSALKDGAEDVILEVGTKDELLLPLLDSSKGKDAHQLALVKIGLESRHRKTHSIYNELRRKVDAFVLELESDFILRNKLSLQNGDYYISKLKEIDKLYNRLQQATKDYNATYNALVSQHSKNANLEADAGVFSLVSLIPAPLDLFKEIIGWINSKRDFRATQVKAINAMLEGTRLRSISEINGNSSPAKSPSADDSDAKGDSKK